MSRARKPSPVRAALGTGPAQDSGPRRGSLVVGPAKHDQRSAGAATGEAQNPATADADHRRLRPRRNTDSPRVTDDERTTPKPHHHPRNRAPTNRTTKDQNLSEEGPPPEAKKPQPSRAWS